MEMMEHEAFIKAVTDEIKAYLPENETFEVRLHKVQKNNLLLDAITIQKGSESVVPTMYLQHYFNEYQDGWSMEEICQDIKETYDKNMISMDDLNLSNEFGKIKDQLEIHLVSKEDNDTFLEVGPYRLNEIGAETVYLDLGHQEEENFSMRIGHGYLQQLGVTEKQLFQTAEANTKKKSNDDYGYV